MISEASKNEIQYNDFEYITDSDNPILNSIQSDMFEPMVAVRTPKELADYLSKNHNPTELQFASMHVAIADYLRLIQDKNPEIESIHIVNHLQITFLKSLYETRDMYAFSAADKFNSYIKGKVPTFEYLDPNVIVFKPYCLTTVITALDYIDPNKNDNFNIFLLRRFDSLENYGVLNGVYLEKNDTGDENKFEIKDSRWSCLLEKVLYTNTNLAVLLIEHGLFDFKHSYYKDSKLNPIKIIKNHAKACNTEIVLQALDNQGIKHKSNIMDMIFNR